MYGGHVVESGADRHDLRRSPSTRTRARCWSRCPSSSRPGTRDAARRHPGLAAGAHRACCRAACSRRAAAYARPGCSDVSMALEPVGAGPRDAPARCGRSPDAAGRRPARPAEAQRMTAPLLVVERRRQGVRPAPDAAASGRPRQASEAHRAVDDVSFDAAPGRDPRPRRRLGQRQDDARPLHRSGWSSPTPGRIELDGPTSWPPSGAQLRELRRRMQMVFQDPYASLNPRMTVGAALLEAGRVHRRPGSENGEQFVRRRCWSACT